MNHPSSEAQFRPPSKYTPTWWQQLDIPNLMSGDDWMREPENLSENTWMVWGTHLMALPATGGTTLFFPTAADCLYWFRWQVLATDDENTLDDGAIELDDCDIRRLTSRIDSSPKGTDADSLLEELIPELAGIWAQIHFHQIQSIHDHLSELGDVELWRRAFRDPGIECRNGRWSLPPRVWGSLRQHFEPYEWGGGFDLEYLLDEES